MLHDVLFDYGKRLPARLGRDEPDESLPRPEVPHH
jgi:hypothetical protein